MGAATRTISLSHDATLSRRMPRSAMERPATTAAPSAARTIVVGLAIALAVAGWEVARGSLYTSRSDVGYALGVVGGAMMCVLILYPVRKHVRALRWCGPLKYWFRLHMMCGIVGPLLILFHSTFRIRSLNAAVALGAMVLVTLSGIVGRYIYRRIHHGLYGSRATLEELQRELRQQADALEPLLEWLPAVRHEVDAFSSLAAERAARWMDRTIHFLSLGAKRFVVGRRIRRIIAAAPSAGAGSGAPRVKVRTLLRTIDATLYAVERTAQFTAYERLFSLWHVLHVPIVYMLVLSAIVHILAVHMY